MIDIVAFLKTMPDYIGSNGRNENEIEQAEAALDTAFAKDYRRYLKEIGLACFDGHELTGITDINRLDIVAVTIEQRNLVGNAVSTWYVVEEANIDGIIIWQSPDGAIYETNSSHTCKKVANSLTDYFSIKSTL